MSFLFSGNSLSDNREFCFRFQVLLLYATHVPFDLIGEQVDIRLTSATVESVDVVITDYGIAINPRRQDLIEAMKDVDLPFKTIEELRDIAYSIAGEPEKVQFGDRVVGIIESRDGTIMDVVREMKVFEFSEE